MRNSNLLFLFIIILFSSCTTYRYAYTASPPNNPYFTQKGETKFTGYYSSAESTSSAQAFAHGSDWQAAYAISDNWALTANYFGRKEKDFFDVATDNDPFKTSTVNYKRRLYGIGGGYFIGLNKKKTITFNAYGGMDFGKFFFKDNGINQDQTSYSRYHESRITKGFVQPSFNFMPGDYFRFSFGFKTSFVHYGHIRTSYSPEEIDYFSLDQIANKTVPFLEPSMNLQFGLPKYPWIKLDATISDVSHSFSPIPLLPYNYLSRLDARGSNASIGLTFDFSKIKKRTP